MCKVILRVLRRRIKLYRVKLIHSNFKKKISCQEKLLIKIDQQPSLTLQYKITLISKEMGYKLKTLVVEQNHTLNPTKQASIIPELISHLKGSLKFSMTMIMKRDLRTYFPA